MPPPKINLRHDIFCRAIAAGQTRRDAYAAAYPKVQPNGLNSGATRLMAQQSILDRIAALREETSRKIGISIPYLTSQLLDTAIEARYDRNQSAAINAYAAIAKIHGFMVDKTQLDIVIRKPSSSPDSPDTLTENEWLEQYGVKLIEHDDNTSELLESQNETLDDAA